MYLFNNLVLYHQVCPDMVIKRVHVAAVVTL